MDLTTIDQSAGVPKLAMSGEGSTVLDPFDNDCPEDARILTTRRALIQDDRHGAALHHFRANLAGADGTLRTSDEESQHSKFGPWLK